MRKRYIQIRISDETADSIICILSNIQRPARSRTSAQVANFIGIIKRAYKKRDNDD